ncbi:hypothetical protein [Abditibacterium utsteinense]|uniref:hypothetical protein n=1 Tax=Abditibacterium utsteinense TaxID=1960156 RepID=UPI000D08709C|nr:hypothetical protein [Abditibacterium utsteinense]
MGARRRNLSDAEIAALLSARGSFKANLPLARDAAEAACIATRTKDASKVALLSAPTGTIDLAGSRFTNDDRLACDAQRQTRRCR